MGKFIVKSSPAGITFELMAANNALIARSEPYTTKAACLKGIESLRRLAAVGVEDQTVKNVTALPNPKYELFKDKQRRYCYRLKARNGKILVVGGGFSSKDMCASSIDSIRRNAPKSRVIEKLSP